MKKLVWILSMAAAATCCGDLDDLWRSTPFYHGASVYTDRKEDRVNLWPLLYHRAPATSVLWPLFSCSDDHVAVTPLYSQRRQGGGPSFDEFNVLWPICQFDTQHDRYRVFPVFWGEDRFAVLPLLVNGPESLFLPPFWYSKDGSCFVALPLCGWNENDGGRLWWASAGLAGHRRDRSGRTSSWLFPLFILKDQDFYSLPYSRFGMDGGTADLVMGGFLGRRMLPSGRGAYWVAPLVYADDRGFVTPLGGYSDEGHWMTLLYSRKGDRFMSIPYASYESQGCTHRWFATPLVGSVSGPKEGGHVFPLLDWQADASFADLRADLDASRAPTSSVSRAERTLTLGLGLLYKQKEQISFQPCDGGKGSVLKCTGSGWSFPLLYNRNASETVEFDSERRPVARRVDESTGLMWPLYTSETRVDTSRNLSKSRSRVLGWLWDREERDGRVSVDVFPGLTFDSHPDGYSKISFLWRLFRYENDPKGGVSLDLFFVPLSR